LRKLGFLKKSFAKNGLNLALIKCFFIDLVDLSTRLSFAPDWLPRFELDPKEK